MIGSEGGDWCVVKIFCRVIVCKVHLEVGNGLFSFFLVCIPAF